MKLEGAIALVTGANRGIGQSFVETLLARGAARVYAAARQREKAEAVAALDGKRVVPLALDITRDADIAAAAARCGDVNLLVNNAGVLNEMGFITGYDEATARKEMDTNLWGTWKMCRAFASALKRNVPSALINVLSIVAKVNFPAFGPYCASKAALWSLTRSIRGELKPHGVFVEALFPGLVDTDMTVAFDAPKTPPAEVVAAALDGIEREEEDVVVCENAIQIEADLRADPKAVEKMAAAWLPQVKGGAA